MADVNRLSKLYGLSPATMAGLAQLGGGAPPAEGSGPPPANEVATEARPAEPAAQPAEPGYWSKFAERLNPAHNLRETFKLLDTPAGSKFVEGAKKGALPGGGATVATEIDARNGVAAPGTKAPDTTPQGPAYEPQVYGDSPAVVSYGGPAMPARAIPAHWQPGSHAVTTQDGIDPRALEEGRTARDVASGHALLAADNRVEAAKINARADAAYAAEHTMQTMKANDALNALNTRREQYVAEQKGKLETLANDIQSSKIDPKAYWQDKGTFGKVMAAIAIGLGQFGASMKGGPNGALQIIQAGIDRNIAAQQANIAAKKDTFGIQSNLYARNLQEFGDKERAILATKINYLDQAASMVEQQRALAKSKEADAAANEMTARIYETRAAYADDFAKLTHTQVTEQMNEHFVPTQVVGGGGLGQKGMEHLYVPAHGGYARTAEEAKALREHDARTRTINATLERAQKIIAEAKTLDPYTIDGAKRLHALQGELDSLSNDAAVKKTVKEGQGAMSKGDKEVSDATLGILGTTVWSPTMYAPTVGPVARWYDGVQADQASKVIAATQERALEENRRLAESTGVMPGKEILVPQPSGSYEHRALLEPGRKPLTSPSIGVDDVMAPPKGVPFDAREAARKMLKGTK